MENNNNVLPDQLSLFNKDNYLKPVPEEYPQNLEKEDIQFIDDFCNSLDEMDRKSDADQFGNKTLK